MNRAGLMPNWVQVYLFSKLAAFCARSGSLAEPRLQKPAFLSKLLKGDFFGFL